MIINKNKDNRDIYIVIYDNGGKEIAEGYNIREIADIFDDYPNGEVISITKLT